MLLKIGLTLQQKKGKPDKDLKVDKGRSDGLESIQVLAAS